MRCLSIVTVVLLPLASLAQINPSGDKKNGTLVIAGSGIASIKHITLETLAHIQDADKIYYAVSDPVTKSFVQQHSKGNYSDLTQFYGKSKSRYETYVQMSEVMLKDVRAGQDVLGIFYGHPGIFVLPSHRAIAIARDEGYSARMLPGVSSQDYLFADLAIDPSLPNGWMTQDATEIVVKGKQLQPDVHNVILQVGVIAVETTEYETSQFNRLLDLLEKTYAPDHIIVHYIGAILPQSKTIADRIPISELRKPEVHNQFTSTSTFYIPPAHTSPVDVEIMAGLGLSDMTHTSNLYPYSAWSGSADPSSIAYGPYEQQAIAKLAHYEYAQEKNHHFSPAMRDFMSSLALKPKIAAEYAANSISYVEGDEQLTEIEKYALSLNHPAPLYLLAKLAGSEKLAKRDEASIMEAIARSVAEDVSDTGSRRDSPGGPDTQMGAVNKI